VSDDSLKNIERDLRVIRWRSTNPGGILIIAGIAATMAVAEFLVRKIGLQAFAVLLLVAGVLYLARRPIRNWRRRAYVTGKYGTGETADRILSGTIWVGQTGEQLRDTFGKPARVDTRVLGSGRTESWKFGPRKESTFALEAILEDGFVAGWTSTT